MEAWNKMRGISFDIYKFFKGHPFLLIIYICFFLTLNLIYLNLTARNLNKSIKVIAEGMVQLDGRRLIFELGQIPQERLNLEIEYFNPQTIYKPQVFLNNKQLKCYKSLRNGPINDYFKAIRDGLTEIDYFSSPEDYVKQNENVLVIEYKGKYPSEIAVKFDNFLYRLPSNNMVISLASIKDKLIFFAPFSFVLIFALVFMTLCMLIFLSKILNIMLIKIFAINGTIALVITIVFGIGLIITRASDFNIKITYFYFLKIVVFCFYNMVLFDVWRIRKIYRNKIIYPGRVWLFDACGVFLKADLFFYFFMVLLIAFGFFYIELFSVSSRIAVLGDVIIIAAFVKCLNYLVRDIKRGLVY